MEHFPRGFEHQLSLNFPAYKDFLKMRERYIVKSEGLQEEMKLSPKDLTEKINGRKEAMCLFFSNYNGKSVNEMMNVLFPQDNAWKNPWFEVSKILIGVIPSILSGDAEKRKEYMFDGEKVGDKLVSEVRNGIRALDQSVGVET